MIIDIMFILACSYTLSQLTWLLIPLDQSSQPAPLVNNKNPVTPRQSEQQRKIQQIPQSHLFGNYESDAVTAPVQTDAPETRLNLELKGLLSATPMQKASAIIALGKGGNEDIYSIGDRVSSATVKEIYADRVILENNGRYETLTLPKEFADTGHSLDNEATNNATDTPGGVLGDIRSKILKNPTSFGDYAIPIPYNENGKLKGYRLQPQGDRALFDKVGLDPNDVIVELNGVKLDNPNRSLKALRKLQNAKSMDITVLRNGAELPLHFEIP
ncbi:MAG: type II secretion system protein GspC [Gammaproteobacteria bacterium]|nr:type II secretion system protein GspC [Gammaproteobacteria bacterium]